MSISLVVKEDTKDYTHHDQLFKELIHHFFEEFLEAFFPQVHQHIDFTTITALSEEMFTDLFEGESRRADIVIEAKHKGEDTMLIIHVEPQSYPQSKPPFHERMYLYYSLLYNRNRKPILPIAVFSYDENRTEKDEFNIKFPYFHVLKFNFLKVELRKTNWREYIESNNPVAAALLSKMGFTEEERVQVRLEFLRMMTSMELNPAKERLIFGFFERYLKLNEKEEAILMENIKHLEEADKIMELPISWEEKGKKEEKKNIARTMLENGYPIKEIQKLTGLNRNEIEKLNP
ncbi:hypothetical protein [Paucisalibacillus globulus]|uniref:hypothetical protein n=1 Tax=Paucisalibacillus globulus TaxID=351095 RepID=UPI0003FB58A0|nr:hypothetical protein [Paucisalibacillus globulus]